LNKGKKDENFGRKKAYPSKSDRSPSRYNKVLIFLKLIP
jgi:hypothetical protein